jgi:cholest-4-en-3-one 26-monooxygenase
MTTDLEQIDLFDPAAFSDGPPHGFFDRLRSESPVHWIVRDSEPTGGFWALTRHADIATVSRDPETFTSSKGIAAPRRKLEPLLADHNIIVRDPPDHTAHRRPLNRSFTPKAVAELEPMVRRIVQQVLDPLDDVDEYDWVPEVAAEVPARVVAALLGMREEDEGKLVEWASDTFFARDGSPESEARRAAAFQEIMAHASELTASRRVCPADDLMSLLVQAEVNGCPLGDMDVNVWFLTFAGAGFETTHTLIAQGMLLLSQRPELRDRLIEERSLIDSTVEEMLRYVAPVNVMARTATRDTEFGGQRIKEGDYVTMWYAASNRDPEVFDRPHEFLPDRSPNPHQAFGGAGSPHFCLGARLARLEMQVILDELATRGFPHDVGGPATRMPSVFINALEHLPMSRRDGQ